jgi:hypothetical protein
VWVADGGQLQRLVGGNGAGWTAAPPGDAVLRAAPVYRAIDSGADRRTGTIYGYDPANQRIVALSKVNGAYIAQYRLADGATGWSDLRGFYIEPGIPGEPDTIVWISAHGIERAVLQPIGTVASPAPGTSASPNPSQ